MNLPNRPVRRRSRGMTIIEVLVSSAILAIVIAAAFTIINSSQKTYNTANVRQSLEDQSRIVIDRMITEIRRCSSGVAPNPAPVLVANADGDSITFQMANGYDTATGNPTWGTAVIYSSSVMTGEINNGVDDDRNGVIDERQITRTQPGVNGGLPVTLTGWLKEGTLRFTTTNAVAPATGIATVRIQFTLERLDPASKTPVPGAAGYLSITVPVDVKVQIRN